MNEVCFLIRQSATAPFGSRGNNNVAGSACRSLATTPTAKGEAARLSGKINPPQSQSQRNRKLPKPKSVQANSPICGLSASAVASQPATNDGGTASIEAASTCTGGSNNNTGFSSDGDSDHE